MSKALLVVEHGVKLNGDAYRKLEEAGFVIVRGAPSQFQTLPSDGASNLTDAAMLECALSAMRTNMYGDIVYKDFAKNVTALALKMRGPRPASPANQQQENTNE